MAGTEAGTARPDASVGRVFKINVSDGGVPKRPVSSAVVSDNGIEGDRQRDTRHHGGPQRAVCLYSLDVIESLRREGHPIQPGDVGENLTIQGIDWSAVAPGGTFEFDGGVALEVTSFTQPCSNIRAAFLGLDFRRIQQDRHPGFSRVYARLVRSGQVREGEGVRYVAPQPDDSGNSARAE